ncbi:MAG: hypothetical protein NTV57_16440 [Cyanobacteria bacterium]|nr:hypothetical protein [Cyanobacteriota bacterium]
MNANNLSNHGRAELRVRLVAVGFVLTGILTMLAATAQHHHDRRAGPGAAAGRGTGGLNHPDPTKVQLRFSPRRPRSPWFSS